MNLNQIDIKNFILALFKRDDGERILLGAGAYDFKDSLQHFQANIIANDVIEKQGTDGQLLAGQVRRCQTQTFEGYIGDASTSRIDTEDYRRKFIQFFRTNHFYTVIYIMPNGEAIQRRNGYLVEAPSAPEQYQRFPEYSVGFQFEDLNYYTYSEDDQGDETYAQTVDIMPEGNLTGGLVWDGDGVVWSNQGKHIAALKGDTYQQSYTGKNLLHFIPVSSQGMTVTYDAGTGLAHVSGKNSSSDGKWANICQTVECLLPAGTYTLSVTKAQSNMDFHLRVKYQDNSTGDFVIGRNNTSKTFTTTKATITAYIWYGGLTPTYSSVDFTVGVQLETGSAPTSFEPYVGGIPAPNPDFPQPIQIATGSQTIFINGKNLIGATEESRTDRGVTITKNQDGTLTFGGTASATYFQITAQSVNGGIATATDCNIPAGEYTLWLTQSTSQFGVTLRLYYSSSQNDYKQVAVAKNATSTTFTIDRPAVAFYIWANGTTVNQSISGTFGIQLEAGSTPTSFEAWRQQTYPLDLGAIELVKLGTAQDRIYKDGEDWKVYKATHRLTLDGNADEGWSSTGTNVFATLANGNIDIANAPIGLCTHAKFNPVQSDVTATLANGEFAIQRNNPGKGRIFFKNTSISAVNDFKAWAAANLPQILYNAYTPTTTTITDANLIAQLDAIDEALEAGGTITVTPAAGNRAAIFELQPSGNGGAVWEASGGHSTNTITVGGLFAVQPVWEIIGPAESPVLENITDGTSLGYVGSIPAGQTLTIDCRAQTATLAGANVKNNVRGTWQSFEPGEVIIRYSGANVTSTSTLKWNEVIG